jgi:hypothetical protein
MDYFGFCTCVHPVYDHVLAHGIFLLHPAPGFSVYELQYFVNLFNNITEKRLAQLLLVVNLQLLNH